MPEKEEKSNEASGSSDIIRRYCVKEKERSIKAGLLQTIDSLNINGIGHLPTNINQLTSR